MSTSNQNDSIDSFATGVYIPSPPSPPTSYNRGLGFMTLDPDNDLLLHAQACDRNSLFSMFSSEAKFYAINASQTWYWGDGTSSSGSQFSHTYSGPGIYEVNCIMDVSFRGGTVVRISAESMVEIPVVRLPPDIDVSAPNSLTGSSGGDTEIMTFNITNRGGKDVIAKPLILKKTGTIDDINFLSISPVDAAIPAGNKPVSFQLIADWKNAPQGSLEIDLRCDYWPMSRGWYLKYKEYQIIPPNE